MLSFHLTLPRLVGLWLACLAFVLMLGPAPHARAGRPGQDNIVRNDGRVFEIQESPRTYSPSHAVTITRDQLKNERVPHQELVTVSPNPQNIRDGALEPESIIGPDGRTRVTDTTVFPYSAIVDLEVHFDFATALCSGWMIAPDRVATAGHCLYYPGFGGWAKSIVAYPGRDGSNAPFGSVNATYWSVRQKWVNALSPGVDYGVIQLASPIGNTVGWFGYQYNDRNSFFIGRTVTVSGYPGDKTGDEADTQWMMQGQISSANKRRLFYSIDTYGGQSGSPLYGAWGKRECSPCGFGIHTYGVGGGWTENSATRITKSVFNFLQSAAAP